MHEKRSHARVPLTASISCELPDGTVVTGTSRDVSLGGMYIESTAQLRFNTELTVAVRLPNAPAESRLPGIVRWVAADGFGVQFGLLGARETHYITELMRR